VCRETGEIGEIEEISANNSRLTAVQLAMTEENLMSNQLVPKKPPSRLQAYLVDMKTSISLFREVLLEVKDLLVVLTLILFFILGVAKALWS
jgi:hypothetical protein